MKNAIVIFEEGRSILDPLLVENGFVWKQLSSGSSSGGRFVSGCFVKGDRKLEIHFRHSLGLIQYHNRNLRANHASLMEAITGTKGANRYPGYSHDPLDGFRNLKHDIHTFGEPFLRGTDEEWGSLLLQAAELEARENEQRLP